MRLSFVILIESFMSLTWRCSCPHLLSKYSAVFLTLIICNINLELHEWVITFNTFCPSFTISDGQAFLTRSNKVNKIFLKHPTLIFQLPFQMLLDLLENKNFYCLFICSNFQIGRNLYIEQEKLFFCSPKKIQLKKDWS